MKRIRQLAILLLVAGLLVPGTAEAQLLKKLKDRARQRVEEKVEDKAEQAVDGAVDRAAESVEDVARSALERRINAAAQPADLNLGPNATAPADAPHVRYKSTTSLGTGAFGTLTRLIGKNLGDQSETVYVSGLRQRTDSEDQSTIIDAENGRFIVLDHKNRQYSVFTVASMMERLEGAVDQAKNEQKTNQSDGDEPDVDVDVKFDMSFERTGRTETVNGSPAELVLITIKSDFDVKAEDEQGQQASMKGTMYTLVDSWVTKQLGGIETMLSLQKKMGERMASDMAGSDLGTSLAALGQDPRLSASIEKAGEEMRKLDGMVVRSTTHLVLVPEGEELDVDAALAPQDKNSGGLAGLAQMAQNMESSTDTGPATQVTLMRITTQISDLTTEQIPPETFEIPSDYAEVNLF